MPSRPHSQLYRQLRGLDPRDPQRIIRMYEEKEREIGSLDVEEHFELTVHYAEALFSTGAFRQFLLVVDPVIEASILHDLRAVQDVAADVYAHLLFRKAVCNYRLRRYDEAARVARSLISMKPDRVIYQQFYRLVLFRRQRKALQLGRGAFILGVLLAAAIIVGQLLVLRPFFPQYVGLARWGVFATFGVGTAVLVGSFLVAHLRARLSAARFRRQRLNK